MDNWQRIVLEWVNCLKLTEPVKKLSSLANGDFFREVLIKLSGQNTHVTVDCNNVQESIHRFIKYAYPDYSLEDEGTIAEDVSELTFVCSLLMHHCAINSEDPCLREPLCNILSVDTQKAIMHFIQSILCHDGTVTREVIRNAILDASNEAMPMLPGPRQCLSPIRGDSSAGLTDFMQSPAAKRQRQLEQYTRELRVMKAELATERDEKIDLQEELQRRENTIKKMLKDLEEKGKQVSNLKSQLFEAENRQVSPVKGKVTNTMKLRTNMKAAEKRIEDLISEVADYEKEKNILQYKLTSVEGECSLYREKAHEYEMEITDLCQQSKTQINELSALRSENTELREMLTEFQNNNRMDKSVSSDSFCLHTEPENLGTVIEIQLKEREAEKQALECKLSEIMNTNLSLQQTLDSQKLEIARTKHELHEKNDQATQLHSEIKCLHKTLDKLNSEYTILQNTHLQTEKTLERKKNEHLQLQNELSELNDHFKVTMSKYEDDILEKKVVMHSKETLLNDAKEKIDKLQADMVEMRENLTEKGDEIEKHKENLVQLEATVNKYKIEIEDLNNKMSMLKTSEKQLTVNVETLKSSLHEEQNKAFNLLIDKEALNKQLIELQTENLGKDKMIVEIQNQIEILQHDLEDLNEKQCATATQLKVKISEIERYETRLAEGDCIMIDKDTQIANLRAQVQKHYKLVEEMSTLQQNLQAEIEKGAKVLEERDQLIKDLENTVQRNEDIIQLKLNEVAEREVQVDAMEQKIANVQTVVNILNIDLEKKNQELTEAHEHIQHVKNQIDEKTTCTDELKNTIQVWEKKVTEVSLERDSLRNDYENEKIKLSELSEVYSRLKSDYELKISDIETLLVEKERACQDLEKSDQNNQWIMESSNKRIEELENTIKHKQDASHKLEKQIQSMERQLEDTKRIIKENESQLSKCNQLISDKNMHVIDLESMIVDLKETLERVHDDARNETIRMQSMHDEIVAQYEAELAEKKVYISELENRVTQFTSEIALLKAQIADNQRDIRRIEEERDALVVKYDKFVADAKDEYQSISTKYDGLLVDHKNLFNNHQMINQELNISRSTIQNLKVTISELEDTIVTNKTAKEHLKFNLESKLTELIKERDEIVVELNSCKHELTEILARNERLAADRGADSNLLHLLSQEKEKLCAKVQEIERENIALNSEILTTKKELLVAREDYSDLENRHKKYVMENETKLKTLETTIEQNLSDLSQAGRNYMIVLEDVEKMRELKTLDEQKYNDLFHEKTVVTDKLIHEKNELQESIKKLESDREALLENSNSIETSMIEEMTQNRQKYEELLVAYTKLDEIKNTVEKTKDELTRELQHVQNSLSENEKAKEELLAKQSKSLSEKDHMISQLETIAGDLKREITKVSEANIMLIKEVETVKGNLKMIQNEKLNLSENNETLQHRYKKMILDKDKEIEEVQSRCGTLERQLAEMQNERIKVCSEISRTQSEIQLIKTSRDQLLVKHSEISRDVEQYIQKNIELNKVVEKLEKELSHEKESRSEIQQMLRKQTDISEKSQVYVQQNLDLAKKIEKLEKDLFVEREKVMKTEHTLQEALSQSALELREARSKVESLCHENVLLKSERDSYQLERLSPKAEMQKLREAYETVVGENNQFQYDLKLTKKTIVERDNQLADLAKLKEAYERVFQENHKLTVEMEAMRVKRQKDREEFRARLEKTLKDNEEKIKELRGDYDVKLEKMKIKMKQLYAEEVTKVENKKDEENQNLCKQYSDKIQKCEADNDNLRAQLWSLRDKFVDAKQDKERMHQQLDVMTRGSLPRDALMYASRESLPNYGRETLVFREKSAPLDSLFPHEHAERRQPFPPTDDGTRREPVTFMVPVSRSSRDLPQKRNNKVYPEDHDYRRHSSKSATGEHPHRRPTTIPRTSRDSMSAPPAGSQTRPSTGGLPMEDEAGEVFNTTFLSDLQAGVCRPPSPSKKSRLTELQSRNSLCPPHLKSSYPAETQFHSPTKFKEDELKQGNLNLDDSLNTCLLPEDKPRRKDRGSTSYKKPGPPTPSKNGGRMSLQGNEGSSARDVLREQQNTEAGGGRKAPTPSRFKALFMGRNAAAAVASPGRAADSEVRTCQKTKHKGKRRSGGGLSSFHSLSPLFKTPVYCPTPLAEAGQQRLRRRHAWHVLLGNVYVWVSVAFFIALVCSNSVATFFTGVATLKR